MVYRKDIVWFIRGLFVLFMKEYFIVYEELFVVV